MNIRIGTRRSRLALIQTEVVVGRLRERNPDLTIDVCPIVVRADRNPDTPIAQLGDKAVFVSDIEAALRVGDIDVAVHSLKDVPLAASPGLTLAAILDRIDARDTLVALAGRRLADLPPGSVIGASSPRRVSQLRQLRPDLRATPIRGNVDTRLDKLARGDVDALILAAAGLIRLDRAAEVTEWLALDQFVPAAGQAALAAQCRVGAPVEALLAAIDDPIARAAVEAERAFAAELGADCHTPIGAHAVAIGDELRLSGEVCQSDGRRTDGRRTIRVVVAGPISAPAELGAAAARQALAQGARDLLPVG